MTAAVPPQRVQFRLREINHDDAAGLASIAELHMELLGYGPMAGLGGRFVREVCYRAHMKDDLLRVALAEVDGRPVGFVAYTPHSLSFHRSGLRKHLVRAGFETAVAVISRPARLIKLLRALRVLGSRRDEVAREEEALGEVVCIAVRQQYLAPSFARASGLRISELLVRHAAAYLWRAGLERMRMLVDRDNRPVLMLYHFLGARFQEYSLGGEPMVEVTFDLGAGRLTADTAVPAAWREETAGGSDDSWRSYWETISDRQGFFAAEARDHIERLRAVVSPSRTARVLDFGCGFGFAAASLAPHVAHVALWDAAATVRRRARLRTAHLDNVTYADLNADDGSFDGNFDLITVHSVVQYMSEPEFKAWLARWKRMLAPAGRLVLSDLIQPSTSAVRELAGYLAFSLRAGFFFDAVLQGIREAGSYSRARATRPLMIMTPGQLAAWSEAAGLRMQMLPANLSYRSSRRSVVLTPYADVQPS